MSRTKPNIPNDDELLSYVEETQTPQEEAKIRQQLNEQSEVIVGLDRLRSDRRMLANINDPDPPDDLIDDCMAAIERELLISDDPMAPPVHMQHRRFSAWHRYTAAAVFFIVASVGGIMIYQTVILAPDLPRFGTDSSTQNDTSSQKKQDSLLAKRLNDNPTEQNQSIRGPKTDSSSAQPSLILNEGMVAKTITDQSPKTAENRVAISNPDHLLTTPRQASSHLKPRTDDVPFTASDQPHDKAPTADLSQDIGLGIRLAVVNRDETLQRIRALLSAETNISLVYNQPRIDTLPANRPQEDADTYKYWFASSSSTNGDSGNPQPFTAPANRNNSMYAPSHQSSPPPPVVTNAELNFVPLTIQHDYRIRGFEYTLVGTPTQLHAFLQSVNTATSDLGRMRILRSPRPLTSNSKKSTAENNNPNTTNKDINTDSNQSDDNKIITIESLMRPPHPKGRDWARSIFWWKDHARNFPLAAQLVESYQPEPIIRIPLRIVGR